MNKPRILIIGGGPAGSIAAIACRRRGFEVTIVEALPFPRSRPGESLPPAIEPLLRSIDIHDILETANYRRFRGVHVSWGKNNTFAPLGSDHRGEWRGYQAIRSDFDERLLQKAVESGARLLQPCKAKKLLRRQETLIGVSTSVGDVFCDTLLDASGGTQWLARSLPLKIETYSPRLIAQYSYHATESLPTEAAPKLFTNADRWIWQAPVSNKQYARVSLRFDGQPERRSSSPHRKAADVTWRCLENPADPGYFCLGDAACVLDPLSSHGVLRAIMSALFCVDLIAKPSPSQPPHTVYSDWIRNWFMHDRIHLEKSYRELPSPPFWIREAKSSALEK